MESLEGRVAIVTGAGRGIGASVARRLATEGLAVVVNDVGAALDGSGTDESPAAVVVQEIRNAGGAALTDTSDISSYTEAENLIQAALNEYGRLDVLVNVAGILRDRMVFNMAEQEWDDVIRVHLKGTFNTTRFASAYWRSLKEDDPQYRIINFTSISGLHGAPGQPNYAAAKMGIVGLTYSTAHALAKYGVTANVVSPAASTRMTDSVPDSRRKAPNFEDRSPDHIGPVVAYLASKESAWINGQVIHADGYQVALYNQPTPICRIVGTQPWKVEDLAESIDLAFRPYLAPGDLL